MVNPPRCRDCRIDMAFSHIASVPAGTKTVYECPRCGATATGEQSSPGVLDW